MKLELSRFPVLSPSDEKQGILLRENIILCHAPGPLPFSRNCPAVIQPNVGQAAAHIWYPHVHLRTCSLLSLPLSFSCLHFLFPLCKQSVREYTYTLQAAGAPKIHLTLLIAPDELFLGILQTNVFCPNV